jgi:hypothetical protein
LEAEALTSQRGTRDIVGSLLLIAIPLAVIAGAADLAVQRPDWAIPASVASLVLGWLGWRVLIATKFSTRKTPTTAAFGVLGVAVFAATLAATAPAVVLSPMLAFVGGFVASGTLGVLRKVWQ